MTRQFRLNLKRETLDDIFKVTQEKIYTEFPLKMQTLMQLENFINKEFKTSEYFTLAAMISIEPYMINLGTYIKVDYDSEIEFITNYDNEIIFKGPVNLQKSS